MYASQLLHESPRELEVNLTRTPWKVPFAFVAASALLLGTAAAQDSKANYKLANKFSNDFVNQFVHSTSVSPQWIGETDRFWYSYQTSDGNHYWLVDPAVPTKDPLFHHERMAGLLSEELRKPIDATHLSLRNLVSPRR